MANVLVIYASTEGQTAKIATYVADRCGKAGHAAHIRQASDPDPLPAFDAVVLAGSLHLGKHQPALVDFVVDHRDQLVAVPSLFLSVSLSAAGNDEDLINADRCVDEFIDATGWRPRQVELVAGGVHMEKINFIKRFAIRRILRKKGVDLDPSGDAEMTDWAALDRAIDLFMGTLDPS